MSLAVFVGLFGPMGSGKSYEAMEFHILPALARRQVVATNIDGVFEEEKQKAIAAYTKVPVEEIKKLLLKVPRTREELFKPGVFPDPLDWSRPAHIPPGALVVLDECSTLLDKALPDFAMRYVTEQRHGVDAAGNTGRMVIISQSPGVHVSLRRLMSSAFVFSKFSMLAPFMKILRPLGLGADYRAEIYTDMSKTIGRGKPDNLITRRYKANVFPCYKSYDAAHAKELGVDKRTTLLGNRWATVFLPIMLLFAVWGGNKLLSQFGALYSSSDTKPATSATSLPSHTATPAAATPAAISAASDALDAGLSAKYRLVGYYTTSDVPVYVLSDTNNRTRYILMSDVSQRLTYGSIMILILKDNSRVTFWSGAGAQNEKNNNTGSATASTS